MRGVEPRAGLSEDWITGFRVGLTQAREEYELRIGLLEAALADYQVRLAESEPRFQARISELEARIAELQEQARRSPPRPPVLKTSENSSRPPSSDSPSVPKRSPKRPTGRKRGAQEGHRGHARQLVEPNQVDQVVDYHPRQCPQCQAPLSADLPDALPPIRRQVWELPRVKPIVTEHRQHTVECPRCHALIKAAESEMPTAGVLRGRWRLSPRETARVLEVVCGLPVSVGGVAGLCRDTSQALEKPHAEIAERVRAEPVVNVDETSWRQAGTKSWLWVMGGKQATLMRVLKRRNSECLGQLLGADYSGTVISDRFSAYKCLPVERRAICWSHLKRDFQSFAD